ncbi:MAG: DegV family protein, partial [Clostridiales bacterium]|nr:DegV family protein [Clostridiales bacterium]
MRKTIGGVPMEYAIVADSSCDMTPELCRQYDVTKIPLSILLGAQAHDDGIDITPDDIYAYY